MLKKICKTLPITVIFSVLTTSALAANSFSCEGAVAEVGIHGTNKVVLKLTSMNTVVNICNPEQQLGSTYPVSPEQCKLAYSTLLTAYAMDKKIRVYFDNVVTGDSCGSFKSWEVATVRYVSLKRDSN